jgi:hypothetical protein
LVFREVRLLSESQVGTPVWEEAKNLEGRKGKELITYTKV